MAAKLLVVCLLAFILELASTGHTLAVSKGMELRAALFAFVMPLICLLDWAWFIEGDSLQRVLLTLAAGVGYSAGTVAVMRWGKKSEMGKC